MSKEAMTLALEALRNSVDLVIEDAYNAEKLYGNYPSRQAKVGGLKVLAEDHKKAIKALEEALAKQEHGEPDDLTIAYMAGLNRGKDLAPQPAQKPWVGLTDEDKHYLNEALNLQGRFPVVDAIEAKLKEKNNG